MIASSLNILVAPESDSTFKVVIGVAFAALWLLAQAASAWSDRKKKKPPIRQPAPKAETPVRERERGAQRKSPPPLQPQRRPQNVPASRQQKSAPPVRQQPDLARRQREAEKVRQQASDQRQTLSHPSAQKAAREVFKMAVPPPPPRRMIQDVSSEALGLATPAQAAAGQSVGPRARLQTLLQPRNLRKEFIITEVLQKPIGLRGVGS